MLNFLHAKHNKIRGVTLVELLVTLTISGLILIGIVDFYVVNVQHNKTMLNVAKLDQELNLAMNIMANDIKRAGYWANAQDDFGSTENNNPFMEDSKTDVEVGGSGNSCILFSYDKDDDGTFDDEMFGIRLEDNAIRLRTETSSFGCSGSSASWTDLTDPNVINVSALTFTLTTTDITLASGATMQRRIVDISITANLTNDTSISRTLTRKIVVRNDKYIPA